MENYKGKRHQNGNSKSDGKMKKKHNTPVKEATNQRKLYECSKCPLKVHDNATLKKHEEIHKRRHLPFKCKFCPASFPNGSGKANHERIHQVEKEPKVRRTPKSTVTMPAAKNNNSNVGTKRKHRQQDEAEEDDDVEVSEPVNKSVGRPHELVPRAAPIGLAQNAVVGTPSIARYFNMAMNACAQSTHSNLVTLHDVDIVRGTIGKITLQFQCNECRGRYGVVRCYRGQALCVTCCGHPGCD